MTLQNIPGYKFQLRLSPQHERGQFWLKALTDKSPRPYLVPVRKHLFVLFSETYKFPLMSLAHRTREVVMEVPNSSLIGQVTVLVLSERTTPSLRALPAQNLIYTENASGMVYHQNQRKVPYYRSRDALVG
jgi:hypothetical protein